MAIDKKMVENAQGPDAFGNKILYRMCEENPLHNNDDVISGKVWLIGRSYAVPIERWVNPRRRNGDGKFYRKHTSDDVYAKIVPKIFTQYYIGTLDNDLYGGLNSVCKILEVHRKLINAIRKFEREDKIERVKSPRSFCSKYLHFHARDAFFIYDSIRARPSLKEFIKSEGLKQKFQKGVEKINAEYDREYAKFFIGCLTLQEFIENKFGVRLTPRQLDNLFIDRTNEGGEIPDSS